MAWAVNAVVEQAGINLAEPRLMYLFPYLARIRLVYPLSEMFWGDHGAPNPVVRLGKPARSVCCYAERSRVFSAD